MELTEAIKVCNLMKSRDRVIDMRSECISGSQMGWSLMINDKKHSIPAEVKKFFEKAVCDAIDYYEDKIKKL